MIIGHQLAPWRSCRTTTRGTTTSGCDGPSCANCGCSTRGRRRLVAMKGDFMKPTHPRPRLLLEALEQRLLCRLSANGEFAITPPSGADAYTAIILRPREGVIGPRTAEANSNGVVNWQITATHEWTPGDQS